MATKIKKKKEIVRQCVICGADITIVLLPKRRYQGGNYFFTTKFDDGTKAEYWECDQCYNEPDTEFNLNQDRP